ncbi:epidermal growth factor-like protein 7 isoform 2-T3 [Liasis olivaceus]
MRGEGWLWTGLAVVLAATSTDSVSSRGSGGCSMVVRSHAVSHLASRVQPVYQPYLTLCPGNRLCSTYRTTYKVSHRQVYRKISRPEYICHPKWKGGSAFPGLGCPTAVCRPPCQPSGRCLLPNECTCPSGWTGRCCQTGGSDNLAVQDEVRDLRSRLAALEEKFQLALAPFLKLPGTEEDPGAEPIRLFVHVMQQLDRIDSLSEQISFLEEQLETCSCKNQL